MRAGRRRAWPLVAAVALCLTLAAGLAPPHPAAASALAPKMGLVTQTPYSVAADGTIEVVLSVPSTIDLAAAPNATLVVTAYRPVTTRVEVSEAQTGDLTRPADSVDLPVAQLGHPAADQLAATITLETTTRTPPALQLPKAGLYPVLFELQNDGDVLAELTTFVHRLPSATEPAEVSLPVAIAMTTKSPVVIDDDALVVVDEATLTEMTRLADLLEASPVPITVRVPPALLNAVAAHGTDGAALAARLAAGLARNDLISSPRYPLDPSQAAAAGQHDLYTQWLRDGEDDLTAFTSSLSSSDVVIMDGPLTPDGGSLLRDLGARLVVTTPKIFDALPDSTGIFTDLSQIVNIRVASGETVDLAITDRELATTLQRHTTTPTLTGIAVITHLLAYRQEIVDSSRDLSGNANGNPARHGVTLGTSDLSLPQADTYRAIATLLAETPGLEPVSLETLGIRTDHLVLPPPHNEVTVGLPEEIDGTIEGRIATAEGLTATADGTAGMLPADDPRIEAWQQTISRFPTSALTDAQVEADAADLQQQFDTIRGSVEVTSNSSFTLTGRTTTMPIRLYNHGDVPLTVKVHMDSVKLTFPDGDILVTIPPQSYSAVDIKIEARTNNTFGVTLTVLTPGGDVLGEPVQMTANVNALSGMANLITGALLLVVLTWWVRHVRQSRRAHAATAAAARHPGRGNGNGDGDTGSTDGTNDASGAGLSPDAATSTLPPS